MLGVARRSNPNDSHVAWRGVGAVVEAEGLVGGRALEEEAAEGRRHVPPVVRRRGAGSRGAEGGGRGEGLGRGEGGERGRGWVGGGRLDEDGRGNEGRG